MNYLIRHQSEKYVIMGKYSMPFCLISEIIHPRFNIILPRVNNFDIKQKKHGIFVLLYGTNTK